jgi:uracil-DNA glycosylase family 4
MAAQSSSSALSVADVQARSAALTALGMEAAYCRRCGLASAGGATRVVMGAGAVDARIVIVGEAPGLNENERGVPFVGRAGVLLNECLHRAGYGPDTRSARDAVFVTNVVKHRPPMNRDPYDSEVKACNVWLLSEARILQPVAVVAVGNTAARRLLTGVVNPTASIGQLRGRRYQLRASFCFPTYHPAAALRNSALTELIVEDLRHAREFVEEEGGEG